MKKTIRNGLIASLLTLATMAAVAIWVWMTLPVGADIPLHWGIDGQPDRWGTKTEAMVVFYIMIGVTLFTTLLLAFLPKIDPRKTNLEKSAKVYGVSWIATMALLAAVTVGIGVMKTAPFSSGGAEIGAIPFVRIVIAGTGILFLVIGNYLPKTRPNWFLGIRTPWTLSSNDTWEKTHRGGGRLFMLVGVATVIAAFLFEGLVLALLPAAMTISTALICVVYSYLVWRGADDRHVDPDLVV